jgi:hypothetical protein
VAASVVTVCKSNSDSKFWSESTSKESKLGPAASVTLVFDGKQYWLDLRLEGSARNVHRAPGGGLYSLESNAAGGLYGALPPREFLSEIGRAVEWESVAMGQFDGKRCQRLIGRAKRREYPLSHVALPEGASCRLVLNPDSKEMMALEVVDSQNQFKYVQRLSIERAKAPFPDTTFRITDVEGVEIHDVKKDDPNDDFSKRLQKLEEPVPGKEPPASKPKEKG